MTFDKDYSFKKLFTPFDNWRNFNAAGENVVRSINAYQLCQRDLLGTAYEDLKPWQRSILDERRQDLEHYSIAVCEKARWLPADSENIPYNARVIGEASFGLALSKYNYFPRLTDALSGAEVLGDTFAGRFQDTVLDAGYPDDLVAVFVKNLSFGIHLAFFRARYPGFSYDLNVFESNYLAADHEAPCIFYRDNFDGLGLPNYIKASLIKVAHRAFLNSEILIPHLMKQSCNKLSRTEIKSMIGKHPVQMDSFEEGCSNE